MSISPASADDLTRAAAITELAELQGQVEAARAVLIRLLQETVVAENQFGSTQSVQLLEANEELVLAALRIYTVAETATQALTDVTRSAELDGLTQLPNRWLLLDRLNHAIAKGRRHGERLAVLFLDLDHFKHINDSQGHAIGDQVLKQAACRMLSAVREDDTVSRYGGDEFVVLLTDIGQASDAARVAEKMLAALALPSTIAGQAEGWSASIGISLYPDDGDDAEALVNQADRAMYAAKERGRGGYSLHSGPLRFVLTPDAEPPDLEQRHAELREANEQLVMAALDAQTLQAAAEQAQQRQTAFLAVVAQGLRNPVVPIRIASSVLGRSAEDESLLKRMQEQLDTQWQQVARLMDDVMDISRTRAGEMSLKRRAVDLNLIVSAAVAASRPTINSRSQHLSLVLPAVPVMLNADADHLLQVFINLLENASKHNPDGGALSLTVVRSVTAAVVIAKVTDTSAGIATADLAGVFEPFAHDSRSMGLGLERGVGMGLALMVVRELVHAHGGQVTANSAGLGQGSEITVTLPLTR